MNEMRSLAAGIAVVGLALLACGKKEDTTDPTAVSASAAASAAPKAVLVDVTRYPDEQAASGTAAFRRVGAQPWVLARPSYRFQIRARREPRNKAAAHRFFAMSN